MANDGAIERIAVLKEKGLSFQEIAAQLDISKDQAQKLHKRYAATHPDAPKDVQVVKSVPKGDYAGFRMAFYDRGLRSSA